MKHPVAEIVDEMSAIMANDRGQLSGMKVERSLIRVNQFQGIDVSPMYADEDEWFVFAGEDCSPDVIWPISVTWGMRLEDGRWVFTRTRTIKSQDARGHARIFSKHMMRRDIAELYTDGRSLAVFEITSLVNNKWVDAQHNTTNRQHDTVRNMPSGWMDLDKWNAQAQMAIGHALRQRYEWSVTVGESGGPSFRFATDSSGVKQMLDERDKGENDRRAALRGWVTDHWRQSRNDPDVEVYVRKHLRGGEAFHWRGYECTWRPSQFDVDKNEEFRAERAMMGRQAKRIAP